MAQLLIPAVEEGSPPGGITPFPNSSLPPYPNAIIQSYLLQSTPFNQTNVLVCGWVSRPFDNVPQTMYSAENLNWNQPTKTFEGNPIILPILPLSNTNVVSPVYPLLIGAYANLPTSGLSQFSFNANQYPYYALINLNPMMTTHCLRIRNTVSIDFVFDFLLPYSISYPYYPLVTTTTNDWPTTGTLYSFPLAIRTALAQTLFSSSPTKLPLPSPKANIETSIAGLGLPSSYATNTQPAMIYPVLSQPNGSFYLSVGTEAPYINSTTSTFAPAGSATISGQLYMIPTTGRYYPNLGSGIGYGLDKIGLQPYDLIMTYNLYDSTTGAGGPIVLVDIQTVYNLSYWQVPFAQFPAYPVDPFLSTETGSSIIGNLKINIRGEFSYVCDEFY